jgi:hypothetical protein
MDHACIECSTTRRVSTGEDVPKCGCVMRLEYGQTYQPRSLVRSQGSRRRTQQTVPPSIGCACSGGRMGAAHDNSPTVHAAGRPRPAIDVAPTALVSVARCAYESRSKAPLGSRTTHRDPRGREIFGTKGHGEVGGAVRCCPHLSATGADTWLLVARSFGSNPVPGT